VIVGAALSLSPEIQPVVPTLTSILSKVLLFVATATMFASLAEDTTARRSIIDTVGIFVVVRMVGATIVAAPLVICYCAGLNMNVLFAALSLLVLFFTPPSSLIDDIFVVQGADSEISHTVKRDRAVMNLIFVSAIVGIYLIYQTGQFLVAVL